MKSIILLNSNENTNQVEEEERTRFVRSILETMGLPLDDIWDENGKMSVEQKIKFRNILSAYNIQVVDDIEGGTKLYCDGQTIGEWKKCEYILKQDAKQRDPRKKLYLEMHIDCFSIFDQQ